jgi:hypothetical protein
MRQIEVSRTVVFHAPRHAREFFEALCTDNLDIGRQEEMQIIFGRLVAASPHVVNDPADLSLLHRLTHLEELSVKARDVNRRMLDAFRVGQGAEPSL